MFQRGYEQHEEAKAPRAGGRRALWGRPEQRKTATRSEWESGRERDREGRDEEEDPIRISIYSRKGSVKRRERADGGRGKECARGKGNLLFLSRSFETHIQREKHTEEMKYGAVVRRD